MFKVILYIHIIFGIIALFTFWIPMIAKKGQKLHIRAGMTYVTAMSVVILSAVLLCILILSNSPNYVNNSKTYINAQSFAWFLLFISILTAASLWYALRVWQFKNRIAPHINLLDLGFSLLLIICSIAMSSYGFYLHNFLYSYFPIIGIFLGCNQLHYWLSTPNSKMHAWFQHMGGMFASVIATLTAFSVTALPYLFPIKASVIKFFWIAPTVIFVPILLVWEYYYKKKFTQNELILKQKQSNSSMNK